MSPESLVIPIVVIVGCIVAGRVLATANLKQALGHRERMRALDQRRSVGDIETRLERIEQAIETIALEVERNGEAQRYLTKALAKHLPPEAHEQL